MTIAERTHFPRALNIYLAIVVAAAIALLSASSLMVDDGAREPWVWIGLILLVAGAQAAKLTIGSSMLSVAEVVLVVMLFALSPGQILVSIALGMAITETLVIRRSLTKGLFNISQSIVGGGAALAIWSIWADQGGALTLRNAAAAGFAGVTYAVVTWLLVDGAVSLAEGKSFVSAVRATFSPIVVTSFLTGSTLGLVFAAAYLESSWTLFLLPAILAEIHLGYHLYQDATVLAVEVETDPLTQLSNRRRFEKDLAALVSGDAVIMVDLDHFKQVNDRLGHDAGDLVLKDFGRCLHLTGRESDSAIRLGGEEFALLIKGGGEPGAAEALDRLREMWTDLDPRTTFSAGVAIHSRSQRPDETVKRADEALMRAKAGGRDRIEFSDPLLDES